MGTLLDLASLVTIPSGYKVGTVYSVVPTDGAGDLSFTRSNDTATRVGPTGLIEKVRTNVNLYSNDFSNANWQKLANATVSATRVADPFGGNTAWQFIYDGTSTGRIEQIVAASVQKYTFSVWLRIASGTATVNVGVGAIGSNFTVTTTWQRFSITEDAVVSFVYPRIRCDSATTIQAYGAQTEISDFGPTDYIPTTTTAVSVGPVANLPRLDYLNSTCPNLLLEPQRTNLALYSEQLNNAEYTTDNATFTANATASPDGYTNADLLTENSSSSAHGFYASVLTRGTTGASLTTSIFAKANGRRYINISGGFDSGNYYNAVFDLQTGVVSAIGNSGGAGTPTASIVSYGNGWYRCILTGSIAGLPNRLSFIYLTDATTGNAVGGRTYTGNGTSGVYFYGYQIEAGAYATSYIPTLGAASTRGADSCSKTGISSLIGQTEGVLFSEFDFVLDTGSAGILGIDGGGTTFAYLFIGSSNAINFNIYISGVAQATLAYTLPSSGRYKIAGAYKANDFVLYVNGVQRASDTSGSVPACSILSIDSTTYGLPPNLRMSESILFETRLTNAELAQLTTL